MQQLNNMDIAILVIVGISALIALGRGLVKEVLSIVGWVLAGAAVIYLLPVLNPFTLKYIESGWMAGIATAAFILIVFMIVEFFVFLISRRHNGTGKAQFVSLFQTRIWLADGTNFAGKTDFAENYRIRGQRFVGHRGNDRHRNRQIGRRFGNF